MTIQSDLPQMQFDKVNLELAKQLSISYPDFLDWIDANQIAEDGDTKDFLAYLGYATFMRLRYKYPDLTLQHVADMVFEHELAN